MIVEVTPKDIEVAKRLRRLNNTWRTPSSIAVSRSLRKPMVDFVDYFEERASENAPCYIVNVLNASVHAHHSRLFSWALDRPSFCYIMPSYKLIIEEPV